MGKLFFAITLCLGFTAFACAYDVINIDLNGSVADPCYDGLGPFGDPNWADVNEWNGYNQGDGVMMASPRCESIGVPKTPGYYAKAFFIADPCMHGYLPYVTGDKLLGDGFVKTGLPTDPNPCLFIWGSMAYGGIYDVYVLANAPGNFTITDSNGDTQVDSLSGGGIPGVWTQGVNFIKFTDVEIDTPSSRNANGPISGYAAGGYLADPDCVKLSYSNQINGIQLASVKRPVRASFPADPVVVAKTSSIVPGSQVPGQWPVDTPMAVIDMIGSANRTNLLCGDYDAAYETNLRPGEHDFDGPDVEWNNGYNTYVDTCEWMEYDIIADEVTAGRYRIRALLNCWWAAADIGIYVDDSEELGRLTQDKYSDMVPPEVTPSAIYWSKEYVYVNFLSGFHKLKWKQNGAYCNILGFQIGYYGHIQMNNCEDVLKYGLRLDSDYNGDCYVNLGDLKVIVDDWLNCNDPCNPECILEEP